MFALNLNPVDFPVKYSVNYSLSNFLVSGWNSGGPFHTTCTSLDNELGRSEHLSLQPLVLITLSIISAVVSNGVLTKQQRTK